MRDEDIRFVTPSEAKGMVCPYIAGQKKCAGGKCMAWKWKKEYVVKDGGFLGPAIRYFKEFSTTHGYCDWPNER